MALKIGKITFTTGLMLIVFFFSLSPAWAAPQDNIETPPQTHYVFRTGHQAPFDRILHARMQEVFKRLGLSAEVLCLPSQRAMMESNTNGDGEAARVKNLKELAPQNTNNLLLVPEVSITMELVVFTKNIDFPVTGWDSLQPYHNGARIGAKILEKNIPGQRTFLPTDTQLMQMLHADRLDTVVEWRLVGQKVCKDLAYADIKVLEPSLQTVHFYPFIHKKHEVLIPQIVQVLKEMKQDGTYQQIRENIVRESL